MRIGIDTYSFHRHLGEVYPTQKPPVESRDYLELIREFADLDLDGLSIESCFRPGPGDPVYRLAKDFCDQNGIEMTLAWGHPFGLGGGRDDEALKDMISYVSLCADLGVETMRIVGSNRRLMDVISKSEQIAGLKRQLKEAAAAAEKYQVTLALENHIDFLAGDILEIVEAVGSRYVGVTYDSGNSLRLGEDPVQAAGLLGSWIRAVHLKDVAIIEGTDSGKWFHWSCVPAGRGLVPMPDLIRTIEASGFSGFYAVELDSLHPDFPEEFPVLRESVEYLRKLPL